MSVHTFFINKILKTVPFEVICTDQKITVGGERIKGLLASVPLIGYERFWYKVPHSSGHEKWVVTDLGEQEGLRVFSEPHAYANDPIQILAVAMLIDVQGFASEQALEKDLDSPSPEFAVATTMHMFLMQVVPTGIKGPFAEQIVKYATVWSDKTHQIFIKQLEDKMEQLEVEITSGIANEDSSQMDTDLPGPIAFDEPASWFLSPETSSKTVDPIVQLAHYMRECLPDFYIQLHEFLPEVESGAVVVQLFRRLDEKHDGVAVFFLRRGMWWRARGLSDGGTLIIGKELETLFRAAEYLEFCVEAHAVLVHDLLGALYGDEPEVLPILRYRAVNRLEDALNSMQYRADPIFARNQNLAQLFGEALDRLKTIIPDEYHQELERRPIGW